MEKKHLRFVRSLSFFASFKKHRRKIGEMVKKLSLLEEPMDVHNILLKAVTFTKRPHEAVIAINGFIASFSNN